MKRIIILLPVVLASLAVGFILYRGQGQSFAEEIGITDGAVSEDAGGAAGDAYGVPGDIFYTKAVKSVIFSHQAHAVDLGFKCSICHNNLFQMQANNVESRPDFNMKGLAEGKYCGSCHSSTSNMAFSSETQCARCHRGVKGLERAEKEGNV